jgi:hypothetical protein
MGMLIGLIGFICFVWSVITVMKFMGATPRFVFNFEEGVFDLDIESPGVYSIAVLGAGFVGNVRQVKTGLQTNNGDSVEVKPYGISPRIRIDGHMATECWYFTAESQGFYKLFLSNLAAVEAKESMSISRRAFQDPIDSRRLKIVVHSSVGPLYQFLSIVGLVVGFQMMLSGFIVKF